METERYVKGSEVRLVRTPSQRVAAKFDGYKPAAEASVEDADYRELQEQAKASGIPANQSKEALFEAVTQPTDQATSTITDDDDSDAPAKVNTNPF